MGAESQRSYEYWADTLLTAAPFGLRKYPWIRTTINIWHRLLTFQYFLYTIIFRPQKCLTFWANFFIKPDAMEALIASVHLTRFMHTPICQLSLGTKQKVNLIAGLFGNPRLLLMDEPFVNLDMVSEKH